MIRQHRHSPWAAIALLLVGAACVQKPELDAAIPREIRNAPYPALIPLDEKLLATPLPRKQAEEIEEDLSARRDRLQTRARALGAEVVDPPARKRMQDGIDR